MALYVKVLRYNIAMLDDLKQLVHKHWGFVSFRPLQEDAMRAVLDGRDSLIVLPTGGGKSFFKPRSLGLALPTLVAGFMI